MDDLFRDIRNIPGVQSVILLTADGKVEFESITGRGAGIGKRYMSWRRLLGAMDNAREADFVFENGRIYLRQTVGGYLLISMQSHASIAMVKLNCDIVLPQLKHQKSSKGLKGFFKR